MIEAERGSHVQFALELEVVELKNQGTKQLNLTY
ncbi:hypothetical protein swp_1421 [Shewanella piezotolerans WP3]|uniref:Uncharacterized protein n=1 Tax=Shewanella piezotolerans (strain WP3 / JCM 13877) TaxID=225849 RepID=B8CKN1_SHEPW|nr:hypothetical protein swp_1421 [Shewanella piezotolerans WP3]